MSKVYLQCSWEGPEVDVDDNGNVKSKGTGTKSKGDPTSCLSFHLAYVQNFY